MKVQIITGISLFFLLFPHSIEATPITSLRQSQVSLSVGIYQFDLDGYSSPYARLTIEGNGIYDQTTADRNGYFVFKNRFSPFSPREACITSQDQFGRVSSQVCLPPFPTTYHVHIGPVIMPPTISLDENNYFMGDEVVLSGQSIPNTDVDLSMFTDQKSNRLARVLNFSLIKPVEAVSLPQFQTKTDAAGNFSISLPSTYAQKYRLFTQADFKQNLSPSSITLQVIIYPFWMVIIKFLLMLWTLLKDRIIEIIILSELFIIAYYVWHYALHPHKVTALVLSVKKDLTIFHARSSDLFIIPEP